MYLGVPEIPGRYADAVLGTGSYNPTPLGSVEAEGLTKVPRAGVVGM